MLEVFDRNLLKGGNIFLNLSFSPVVVQGGKVYNKQNFLIVSAIINQNNASHLPIAKRLIVFVVVRRPDC